MASRPSASMHVCGVAAVAGAVLPFVFLIPWIVRGEANARGLLILPFATPPAALPAADVLWSAAVFLVFAVAEGRRAGVRPLWLAPAMVPLMGLCCALPLFLWLRERALSGGG